ncbi:hypothetical protein HDU97_005264 [Phlyctochytrium planicorne]|nr:hypothetical protein HDU97_005264 [Phlyctochytrium planicorne]
MATYYNIPSVYANFEDAQTFKTGKLNIPTSGEPECHENLGTCQVGLQTKDYWDKYEKIAREVCNRHEECGGYVCWDLKAQRFQCWVFSAPIYFRDSAIQYDIDNVPYGVQYGMVKAGQTATIFRTKDSSIITITTIAGAPGPQTTPSPTPSPNPSNPSSKQPDPSITPNPNNPQQPNQPNQPGNTGMPSTPQPSAPVDSNIPTRTDGGAQVPTNSQPFADTTVISTNISQLPGNGGNNTKPVVGGGEGKQGNDVVFIVAGFLGAVLVLGVTVVGVVVFLRKSGGRVRGEGKGLVVEEGVVGKKEERREGRTTVMWTQPIVLMHVQEEVGGGRVDEKGDFAREEDAVARESEKAVDDADASSSSLNPATLRSTDDQETKASSLFTPSPQTTSITSSPLPTATQVSKWTPDQVAIWLESMDVSPRLTALLREKGVGGVQMLGLTDAVLMELGLEQVVTREMVLHIVGLVVSGGVGAPPVYEQ